MKRRQNKRVEVLGFMTIQGKGKRRRNGFYVKRRLNKRVEVLGFMNIQGKGKRRRIWFSYLKGVTGKVR